MKAIILAAGMGTRLRPLTYNTPKALINVNGKPMIERQIEFLKATGIEDIIIVTGYLNEKFHYLESKYNVKTIYNDKYDKYNNIYSMYLVKDYLKDCYVIDGDTYLTNNFLINNLKTSTYFSGEKQGFLNEWVLQFDNENRVNDIVVKSGQGYIMSGVSYWTEEDGIFLKEELEKAIETRDFKNLYWDNIVAENLNNIYVKIEKINCKDWFEIDSISDLNNLLKQIT